MAFSSVNFDVVPGDALSDWVQVSVNPLYLRIQARDPYTFQVAVTATGAPVAGTGFATLHPASDVEGSFFELPPVSPARACEVYVRVPSPKALQGTVQFGVIRDQ